MNTSSYAQNSRDRFRGKFYRWPHMIWMLYRLRRVAQEYLNILQIINE